ncbi:tRNA (N6-isopentenyl adenosine(37)-C2)-methylthiotransferase MiaB [bacterium]|nr:tRNA (N6-isopentenyl adenosine(37)-C2)-methylthiotransferase MiaB [bacterium]
MKKFYIETQGCQMNKSDTERMSGMLMSLGMEETDNEKEADLLIINTCSIRQLAEDKAFSKLGVWGKLKKARPEIKIGICGCVAQVKAKEIKKRAPYVDLIFGTHNIYELPKLVEELKNTDERIISVTNNPYVPESDYPINRAKSVNAWIPIMEGCNNFCTYCVVPFTRGRERSRRIEDIVKEAKKSLEQGYKEITLLGQNVDSYGKDFNDGQTTLANLLRELNKIEGKFRLRFVTSYPTDITDDLINAVKECDKVAKYFHIPMQSGNTEVLKAMNRRYTREQYGEIIKKLRKSYKEVSITSDFIAGFPGETEEQFNDTLSAIEKFELDYSNTAAYSPRPNTKAAKMTDLFLSEKVKSDRLFRLNECNKKAVMHSNQKCHNKIYEVLVEDIKTEDGERTLTARTEGNKIVHIKSDKNNIGDFLNVKITGSNVWCLFGEVV